MKVLRCFFFFAETACSLFRLYFAALAEVPVVAARSCWKQGLQIHCIRDRNGVFKEVLLH